MLLDVAEHPEKTTSALLLLARCAIGAPRSLWVAAKPGGDKGLLTAEEDGVMKDLKSTYKSSVGSDRKQPSKLRGGQHHCKATFYHL